MMLALQPRIQLFFCLEPATEMFSGNHLNPGNRTLQVNSEAITGSLFDDHIRVIPTPVVTKDNQVQISDKVQKQVSLPQQFQENEQAQTGVDNDIHSDNTFGQHFFFYSN